MALRAKRSVIMTSMTALARLTGMMQAEACRRGREEEACFSLCTAQQLSASAQPSLYVWQVESTVKMQVLLVVVVAVVLTMAVVVEICRGEWCLCAGGVAAKP
jgi:hypothetical protein